MINLIKSLPKGLLKYVLAFNGFNVLDAIMTLFVLSHGGRELNPIMVFLINSHPIFFVLTKLSLAGIMTVYWIKKGHWKSIKLCALAFYSVCVWNSAMIFSIIERAVQVGRAASGN